MLPASGDHWGADVSRRRVALGLTQEAFAIAIGIPLRTLQGWEGGRKEPAHVAIIERAIADLESRLQAA